MTEEKWKESLWNTIVEEARSKKRNETRQEGEKTYDEFASETGMSIPEARRFLHDLVRKGVMTKRVVWLKEFRARTALFLPVNTETKNKV